jgi:hypothetical protein
MCCAVLVDLVDRFPPPTRAIRKADRHRTGTKSRSRRRQTPREVHQVHPIAITP